MIAAWRRGTWADWTQVSGSLFFYAMPTQWLGLMLIILFAGILPISGISDPFLEFSDPSCWTTFVDRMKHMILPALTLGLVLFGEYALITRSALLADARRGLHPHGACERPEQPGDRLPPRSAKRAPADRLAHRALVGYLVGGSILVEAVFSYPGIGLEIYEAVFERDFPMLQGAFLILTISVVLANLVADLLYFKLDPRVAQ